MTLPPGRSLTAMLTPKGKSITMDFSPEKPIISVNHSALWDSMQDSGPKRHVSAPLSTKGPRNTMKHFVAKHHNSISHRVHNAIDSCYNGGRLRLFIILILII